MGDQVEITLEITPETPGRPLIRNPFESPNDYHHLCEALVPSPSVFKSKPCRATPPKFDWSIEEMASLQPAHIDPEEIQRQSFYLSRSRTDSEIEKKCQNAIEQFFTKGTIVPSPWAAPDARKESSNDKIAEESENTSVACQTTLSLPLTFDLEKVLGDFYHNEEVCDAVQESLSSSSLRRKLFLDGQGSYSGSDSSSPSSPERGNPRQEIPLSQGVEAEGGVVPAMFSSPLPCGALAQTPSTGQFSSSPIQNGCFRDCSLGSITSPRFPDRLSPSCFVSPTVSPIVAHASCTPTDSGDGKQLINLTPLGVPLDVDVTSSNESPFVEGCSPIRNCSPHHLRCYSENQPSARPKTRPRVRSRAPPPLNCPVLNPKLQDNHEAEEQLTCSSTSSSFSLPLMELDPYSSVSHSAQPSNAELNLMSGEAVKTEDKETGIEQRLEDEGEESGEPSRQLSSSHMGSVSAVETSHMFVSLLTEGSSIRCDSSMQVDSGYSTTSAGTASLIDGLSSDLHSKESFTSGLAEEALHAVRQTKVKVFHRHHADVLFGMPLPLESENYYSANKEKCFH